MTRYPCGFLPRIRAIFPALCFFFSPSMWPFSFHTSVPRKHTLNKHAYTAIPRKVVGQRARNSPERKVLWVVLSSLFFREIWKNSRRGHGHMSVTVLKESDKSRLDSYSVRNSVLHIFSDNLSRNSCICVPHEPVYMRYKQPCVYWVKASRGIRDTELYPEQ